MSRIHLHIDRVTLEGLGALDGATLRRSLERELGRLLAGNAVDRWHAADDAARDGGTIDVAPRATASSLGRTIGGALFGAVTAPSSTSGDGGKGHV